MADETINLFGLASRGVNVVTAATHLAKEEVTSAQNAEYVTAGGEGALDQRAGMTRINGTTLAGGSAIMAHDVPAQFQTDLTPTLYAPLVLSSHDWRTSTDGTTWSNTNNPAAFAMSGWTQAGYFKSIPKIVTVGNKFYFNGNITTAGVDAIPVWEFDGTTGRILSYIPPAVFGGSLVTPNSETVNANGTTGATTYTYRLVATGPGVNSAGSATFSTTIGNAALSATNFNSIVMASTPVAGATSYDVYRTVGGGSTGLIGTIPIVGGGFTAGNGSGIGGPNAYYFTDGGLVGNAAAVPAASGSTTTPALQVMDMITDGTNLYMAVLDSAAGAFSGRLLQFNPVSVSWVPVGATFPVAAGAGVAGTLCFYDGALNYATYLGFAAGNTMYAKTTSAPLPAGGIIETHSFAVSQAPASMAMFQGVLYVGSMWVGAAGTAGIVVKRVHPATWSTSKTGPGTATYNGYTSLFAWQGRLYAGWTSGDGSSAAVIQSTADGITWSTEVTLNTTDVVGQFCEFQGALYVCLAKTAIGYNTTSSIRKRTSAGAWSNVDAPADNLAGGLGIVWA